MTIISLTIQLKIDKISNDSDVTINSIDVPKENNIKNENSDDTSTSMASAPTQRLNKKYKKYTATTMTKTPRRTLKKKMVIILWALNLANNKLISEQKYNNFWKHKFGINNPQTDKCINMLNDIIIKLQCTYISLAALCGDEFISHFEHISTMMITDNEESWQSDKFWNKIKDKWHAQNKVSNKAKMKNVAELPADKSTYLATALGNHCLLRKIWDWVVQAHQPEQVTKAINDKKLSQYQISIDLFVFFFELAHAMWKFRLCSHKYESTTKNHSERDFKIPQQFEQWIQNSYKNRNALRTKLIFESVNTQNNHINAQFKHGITSTQETTIKLKSLFKHNTNRKYFMDHWNLMCMKFVIFYPIIAVSITGNFEWNKTNFMLPLQQCSKVIQSLSYAHNWKSVSNNVITSFPDQYESNCISDEQPSQYEYIAATTEQQMKLVVEISHTIWIHNMANSNVKGDALVSDSFSMNLNNQILLMPKSTALASFPPSSWRSRKSKLIYVKTRGAPQQKKHRQTTKMRQLRYTRNMCSQEQSQHHQLLNTEAIDTTHEIIEKTIDHSNSDWQKYGYFGTGLTKDECDETFIKHAFMYPAQPWTYKRIITPPLECKRIYTFDNLCFGCNLLWKDAKQWQLMKSNEYYHTTQMLHEHGKIEYDTSQYWSSNDSEKEDPKSDGEEIGSESDQEEQQLQQLQQNQQQLKKPQGKESKKEIDNDNENHIKGFSDGDNDELDDSNSLHLSDDDVITNNQKKITPMNQLYNLQQEYPYNPFDVINKANPYHPKDHDCHDNCNCMFNDISNTSSIATIDNFTKVNNQFNEDKFANIDTQFGQILTTNIVKTPNFKPKTKKHKDKKTSTKTKPTKRNKGRKRNDPSKQTRTAKKVKYSYKKPQQR